MDRHSDRTAHALGFLSVLAAIAALYLLKTILIPIAFAMVVACMFSPLARFFRSHLPYGPTGALILFLVLVLAGLYLATLTAEGLLQATYTLPSDIERLSGQVSGQITMLIHKQPWLGPVLPEPGTIDRIGDTNRALLIEKLSYSLTDFTTWVAQGFIILVLIIFLLVENEMLTAKLIRFFARTQAETRAAAKVLGQVTQKIRAYLIARTLINAGLGLVVALVLWLLKIRFAFALGLVAALTNFVPYIGQLVGGALPTVVALGQTGSIGQSLLVAGLYLAVLGVEGYVVTPMVMGRSLDLNGTTILIACLFWGYLWGLVGLVLAMPITVSMKVVFQTIPELNRWAELMSLDWQSPAFADVATDDHERPARVVSAPSRASSLEAELSRRPVAPTPREGHG